MRSGWLLFAGNWNEGFDDQGDNGNLWSSSAFPDTADNAFNANFNSDNVNLATTTIGLTVLGFADS